MNLDRVHLVAGDGRHGHGLGIEGLVERGSDGLYRVGHVLASDLELLLLALDDADHVIELGTGSVMAVQIELLVAFRLVKFGLLLGGDDLGDSGLVGLTLGLEGILARLFRL